MIYSGPRIKEIVARSRALAGSRPLEGPPPDRCLPFINVEPWNPENVRPNSVDLTLSDDPLKIYSELDSPILHGKRYLDPNQKSHTIPVPWHNDTEGKYHVLEVGTLYLASTLERTETHGCVPWIEGRSSWGRLGLQIHVTAGFGDDGFNGRWTLELVATHRVLIRPGMKVCQVVFSGLDGPRMPYAGRYQGQTTPTASRLHLDADPAPLPDVELGGEG